MSFQTCIAFNFVEHKRYLEKCISVFLGFFVRVVFIYMQVWKSVQGSRLILPTGRTCATNFLSWSHVHIIWSQIILFFWYIWLIIACWWTFIIVYSYMVTKVFNIQPFFISIICDLNFVTGIPLFVRFHFQIRDLGVTLYLSLFKTKTKDGFIVILN